MTPGYTLKHTRGREKGSYVTFSSSGVLNISQANFRYVQSLCFYTHSGHALPYLLRFN